MRGCQAVFVLGRAQACAADTCAAPVPCCSSLLITALRLSIAAVPSQRSAQVCGRGGGRRACRTAAWRAPTLRASTQASASIQEPASQACPSRVQHGDAVLLLRAATPGDAGAARDWLRMLTGKCAALGLLRSLPPSACEVGHHWLSSACGATRTAALRAHQCACASQPPFAPPQARACCPCLWSAACCCSRRWRWRRSRQRSCTSLQTTPPSAAPTCCKTGCRNAAWPRSGASCRAGHRWRRRCRRTWHRTRRTCRVRLGSAGCCHMHACTVPCRCLARHLPTPHPSAVLPLHPVCPAAHLLPRVCCLAVLTFHQCFLGILLPIIVAACTAPGPLPLALLEAHGVPAGTGMETTPSCELDAPPQRAGRVLRRLASARWVLLRIDGGLRKCCRAAGSPAQQGAALAAACALLAANMWVLSVSGAARSVASGSGPCGSG